MDGAVILAASFLRAAAAPSRLTGQGKPASDAAEDDYSEADSDEAATAPREALSRCMALVGCAVESVVVEAAFAAAGTFIAPGTGTFILQLIGSLVAWL